MDNIKINESEKEFKLEKNDEIEVEKENNLDFFVQNKLKVDYHDPDILKKFLSTDGKILPRRRSGLNAKNQRRVTKAIKRARILSMLMYKNLDA
ncbi:MAG: 30S ribosomal protein S18 [Deltaproteobacteria bacterium]|nr:MAG: 30S ribosomal protein S18 [Deltaproteobacteria bacterium]